MEWSRSPSRSREPLRRRRPALPPGRRRVAAWGEGSDRRFRLMVALSGGLHVIAFLSAVAVDSFHRRIVLPETVAVVDLVGAPSPPEEPPGPPAAAERPSPPARPAPAPKAAPAPRPSAPAKAPSRPTPEATRPSTEGLLPPRPAAAEKAAPPDARSAEEAIRALRDRRDHSDRVRDIVERRRKEREVASAIGSVRERASREVDLSSLRPGARGGAPRSSSPAEGASGAVGNVRATAEQIAYFRALDERVRSNWIAPKGDTRALMVQVVVTIEKNGDVSDVKVEKGSGNGFFDDSVQRAIRKASPLPVPPERLRGGEACYSVGFRFYGAGGGDA